MSRCGAGGELDAHNTPEQPHRIVPREVPVTAGQLAAGLQFDAYSFTVLNLTRRRNATDRLPRVTKSSRHRLSPPLNIISRLSPPPPPILDQLWFGVWASDVDSRNFTSLVWDCWDDETIEQQGEAALRFLYQVGNFFCSYEGNKTWSFYPDYQARWNRVVPKLRQLLVAQKILGFMIGDESVDKGLSIEQWETIIQTVRATFPQGTAIIYANDYVCSSTSKPDTPCVRRIPDALDWISSATYRSNSSSGFIGSIRASYENHIYPKLHSHQKIAVIPEVGQASYPRICDDECMARIELQDAKDTVAWARSDSRVALIAPYLWTTQGNDGGLKDMSGANDLKKYWEDFGRSTKHNVASAVAPLPRQTRHG